MAERKCGHHSVNRRTAEVGNGFDPRDSRDVEIERLQQRIQELELQHEDQWSSKHTWDQDEGNPFNYVRGRRDRHGVDRQEDPLRSLELRIEIPEFVSKSHPDDFIDWLSTVKRIFDLRDVPKELKVKVVAMKLRQHASLWWDHVKKQRYLAVEELINKFDRYVCCAMQMKRKSILLLDVCRLTLKVEKQQKNKGKTSTSNSSKAPRCYKCQGLGHYSREYPNQKTVSFVEEESEVIYDIDGNDVDESLETELLYPDQSESLVIQRILSVPTSKSIDDDSCENLVSTYMVEKLTLKIVDHPEPYQLTWLKKWNNVKVSKRYLVHFSIGKKYSNEVWCEVVPMDAYGMSITLAPLDSRQSPEADSALVLNRVDFENVAKISPLVFVLVVEKANKVASAIPSLMQPLLMEFDDVVPEEIPLGLPMMWDIQH
nr:hypothetical protein [Tanacetum cinerariifolium]